MLPRITQVHYLHDYMLEITFTTGEIGRIDFGQDVLRYSGVLAQLRDKNFFAQVRVDTDSGTLIWPSDIDFDPDVLYARATGASLPKFATSATVRTDMTNDVMIN